MTLKTSYQQIAINAVLIIAGKLKSIIPIPMPCRASVTVSSWLAECVHALDRLSCYVQLLCAL